MEENICMFVTSYDSGEEISILNFVLERKARKNPSHLIVPASYSINLVSSGSGVLHTPQMDYNLSSGDLFFIRPGKPYYIENISDLEYMYITFLGTKPLSLIRRVTDTYAQEIYKVNKSLIAFWLETLKKADSQTVDLYAQSVLYHTVAVLSSNKKTHTSNEIDQNAVLIIKKYVDENFTNPDLSLQSISKDVSYNYKYISTQFKRTVRISFNKYLQKLRLENAKKLMDKGLSSVKEIANCSGYNDPLYFSRTFKKEYGISPSEYIQSLHSNSIIESKSK